MRCQYFILVALFDLSGKGLKIMRHGKNKDALHQRKAKIQR